MEEPQSDPNRSDDRRLQTAESLREFRDQADQALDSHRRWVGELETRLHEQLQNISDAVAQDRIEDEAACASAAEQAELLKQLRETLDEKEAETEELAAQLNTQTLQAQTQLAERDEELEQILELNEAERKEMESLQQSFESAQQTLQELRNQECTDCSQSHQELTALTQQLSELNEQFVTLQELQQSQQAELDEAQQASQSAEAAHEQTTVALAEAERQVGELNEQFVALQTLHQSQQAELDQAQQTSRSAEASHEQTTVALAKAEQQVTEIQHSLQESEAKDEQLEQTRRKFELTLADVHKFKRENAELHEELLSRPAADDQESPELTSLRAERDALAERIAEVENAPAPTVTEEGQNELEDLQRRFELAVDDVRQLKQTNADLSQQLEVQQREAEESGAPVSRSDESPAQDWQAQKARLLASLDAEDQGDASETRREELATVEGTISITDRVVAEKDTQLAEREDNIAKLQAELEARPAGVDLEELREQIAAEILGDEAAVQAECEKLQEQQLQLDAKLREAELELSVQRATLAREQSALEDKLAQLPSADEEGEASSNSKPRRRWLSAMGIRDEDES